MSPTPAPDLALPKAARVVNIITALTGVVASGLLGFCAIFTGIAFVWLVLPLVFPLLIVILLYQGCGAYGVAFTRFERLPLGRLFFQTCVMGGLVWGSARFFQKTHPLPDDHPLWHPTAATVLLILISLTFLSHLLSLSIWLVYPPSPHPSY